MIKETFTGPKDSWEIIFEVVQNQIELHKQFDLDGEGNDVAEQIQAALNSIYEGSE